MDNKTNHYSYSAAENQEIKRIREKYVSKNKELSKIETLRNLDKSVTTKATVFSLIIGTIGSLVFGAGLSFALVWTKTLLIAGIILGVLGALIMISAYPVFNAVSERKRKEVAPQILELADELLK